MASRSFARNVAGWTKISSTRITSAQTSTQTEDKGGNVFSNKHYLVPIIVKELSLDNSDEQMHIDTHKYNKPFMPVDCELMSIIFELFHIVSELSSFLNVKDATISLNGHILMQIMGQMIGRKIPSNTFNFVLKSQNDLDIDDITTRITYVSKLKLRGHIIDIIPSDDMISDDIINIIPFDDCLCTCSVKLNNVTYLFNIVTSSVLNNHIPFGDIGMVFKDDDATIVITKIEQMRAMVQFFRNEPFAHSILNRIVHFNLSNTSYLFDFMGNVAKLCQKGYVFSDIFTGTCCICMTDEMEVPDSTGSSSRVPVDELELRRTLIGLCPRATPLHYEGHAMCICCLLTHIVSQRTVPTCPSRCNMSRNVPILPKYSKLDILEQFQQIPFFWNNLKVTSFDTPQLHTTQTTKTTRTLLEEIVLTKEDRSSTVTNARDEDQQYRFEDMYGEGQRYHWE